jgi:tetratricopeptide (TPR) repeat protein
MKKQIIFALALLIGVLTYAQKSELRTAERAIKSGNFADAKSAIQSAESLIGNADNKTKAKFYFLKGQALYANGAGSNADQDIAIEILKKVKELETKEGRFRYTSDVVALKQEMLSNYLTKANASLQSKNYIASSDDFEKAYRMSPKDTLYLYYAASTAVTAQNYDKSLKYYEELRTLGFKGYEMEYTAFNIAEGKDETFDSKSLRDFSVKSNTHNNPKELKSDSKSSEIIKNIALIYVNKGENEKAIAAIKDARKENPEDLGLILSEANVQLKLGNKEEFKKSIQEATLRDPDNAELQYNLGVIAADAGEVDVAKKYYNKAIALDPNYADAQNNMAVLILAGEQNIIKKMNALGSSSADNKKYDEYKEERLQIYKDAIPYLEAALRIKPNSLQASKTLMNIYSAISETEKFKLMKAKVEALESGN